MEYLTCPICGREGMKFLTAHITRTHKMSKEEFLDKYPGTKLVTDELNKQQKETLNTERSKLWKDPEHRKMMSEVGFRNMNELNKDPRKSEWCRNAALVGAEMYKDDPEHSKRRSEAMKTAWSLNPQRSKDHSQMLKERWTDPEYRDRQTERFRRQVNQYWTDPEIIPKMGYYSNNKYLFETDSYKLVMRSSWEVTLAEILYESNIKFLYEELIIPYEYEGKSRKYITDFYLPDYNLIVEVKPEVFIQDLAIQKIQACIDLGYRSTFMTERTLFGSVNEVLNYLQVKGSTTIEKDDN